MPKETKRVKVAASLEHELLAAVVRGAASPSIVDQKELSKIGRIVHNAVVHLSKNGLEAPFKLTTIFAHCISNLGAPEEDTRQFLRDIQECYSTKDHKVLLKIAKEKEALVGLLNEASKQLASGDVQLRKFSELAEKQISTEKLTPMSEMKNEEPPYGIDLVTLPTISQAARGVQGVWIIGGREGVGKSTLGLQIAIELQQELKVLYYDIDGTGEQWMKYRITQAVGEEGYKDASKNLFYRGGIESLDSDLTSVPSPACLVVDSIQTLPYQLNHRRSSVDGWLNTFKGLINKGYITILISELSREGEYKESSGINYAGTMNLELVENDEMISVIVKKNRHGPRKGHIATLARNPQYPFLMEEV